MPNKIGLSCVSWCDYCIHEIAARPFKMSSFTAFMWANFLFWIFSFSVKADGMELWSKGKIKRQKEKKMYGLYLGYVYDTT